MPSLMTLLRLTVFPTNQDQRFSICFWRDGHYRLARSVRRKTRSHSCPTMKMVPLGSV